MIKRRWGAAVLVLLVIGLMVIAGKGVYVRFALLGKDPPVSVCRFDGAEPEPVEVAAEDARRIVDLIGWNGFSYRLGTSDSIGVFRIEIGDRVFGCNDDGGDLNDYSDNLNIRIAHGREELLRILLKYTQADMP